MKKALYLPLFLLASGAALADAPAPTYRIAADDAAILTCRTLADRNQRLDCYDALQVNAVPAGVTLPSAAPAAATAAPAAPAATASAARTAEQSFGMEQAKKKTEADFIESTIVGDFDGWQGNTVIKLANGQVWRISDGSSAYLPKQTNPTVRIKRGVLGAIYFQVVGQNNMARVRRVE